VTAVNGTADCELGRDSSWGPNVANCSNIGVEGIHIGDVMNCLNTNHKHFRIDIRYSHVCCNKSGSVLIA